MKITKTIITGVLMITLAGLGAACGSAGSLLTPIDDGDGDTTIDGEGVSPGPSPIPIPAPTGGYINGTAPDVNGKAFVYGFIEVDGIMLCDVTLIITNEDTGEAVTVVTDANGFFSASINASAGDIIKVRYTDPATGEESEAASIAITSGIQPMSSNTMIPMDVDLDEDDGLAVIVANDGTNSEIIEIDMVTGEVHARATFAGKTFDKIAVHSGLDHAAVLDTGSRMLYWYDLANLADDMTAAGWDNFTTAPHDVAVIDLDNTRPSTPFDFIAVANDLNTSHPDYYGYITTFAINNNELHTLAYPRTTDSINSPKDQTSYGSICSAYSKPACVRATNVSLIETESGQVWMAIVAVYANGDKAVHFARTHQYDDPIAGPTIYLEVTLASLHGTVLTAGVDPADLAWYDDDVALLTDTAGGNLIRLTASGVNDIDADSLPIGNYPMGLSADAAGSRAFVAAYTANSIVNIDMAGFQLSGTSYAASYKPTDLVYYQEGSVEKLGVILTEPLPMFQTIDVSQ